MNTKNQLIMGLDVGSTHTGYAIIAEVGKLYKDPSGVETFGKIPNEDVLTLVRGWGNDCMYAIEYPYPKNNVVAFEVFQMTEWVGRIMVLSQLNRDGEKLGRPPQLIDLREAGSIEQDADLVMLLWQDKTHDNAYTHEIEASLNVAKQRNGPTNEFKVVFSKPFTLFYHKDDYRQPDYDLLLGA